MLKLEDRILELLETKPGLKAREIASSLGSTFHDVNSILYGQLSNICQIDKSYRWSLKSAQPLSLLLEKEEINTDLTKLCNYYLACLGYDDDNGISVYATSKYGIPDYIETKSIINLDINQELSTAQGQELLKSMQKDQSKKALFLGYPCFLRHTISQRTNWQGFFVEPLMYLPITKGPEQHSGFILSNQAPIFNYKAIKSITQIHDSLIAQEINQLEEELGYDAEEPPGFEELVYQLRSLRKYWPWKGEFNASKLENSESLGQLDNQGIYNKAIIVMAEKSPFTIGLESELKVLAATPESVYSATALGRWLQGKTITENAAQYPDILEVFPMNSEQRQAVTSSLENKLTVITGPPGTGKSQVVTNLLINSFWNSKRVLFSSKNNQAVDVVEARVNSMGSRPILLRTGSNEHKDKLANYLLNYLDQADTSIQETEYKTLELKRNRILAQLKDICDEEQRLLDQRNSVDKLENEIEYLREKLLPKEFGDIGRLDTTLLRAELSELKKAALNADRRKQGFIIKILWNRVSEKRVQILKSSYKTKLGSLMYGKRQFKNETWSAEEIDSLYAALELNSDRVADMVEVQQYLIQLKELLQLKPLEDLSRERMDINEQLSERDYKLWKCYLDLLPKSLTTEQKRLLADLRVSVQLMKNQPTNTTDEKTMDRLRKRNNDLLFQLSDVFPCWAVTSLSAKGRIPFEPGYFDLVVIDEASQCDIASALPLLFRAKAAVIIGDKKQLRHISNLPEKQDLKLLLQWDEKMAKLVWMYSQNSLFDLALAVNDNDAIGLKDHHRSHNDVIEFSNRFFYNSTLRVATKTGNLKTDRLKEQGIRWVDVPGSVIRPNDGGAYNPKEADEVIKQIRRLVIDNDYLGTIGVVTPFRAQANHIRKKLSDQNELQPYILRNQILVDVVHKYQGDEKDVMIFSPVFSANMPAGGLRFLAQNPNLFNVAITRARALLVVVGDLQLCLQSEVVYLREFARYTQDQDRRQKELIQLGVDDLSDDYPMVSDLSIVSDWEKVLYKALFRSGIKAIPQYVVDRYILDFALFSGNRKLDIEVDGEHYHRSWNGELCRRDQIRNQRMFELGWDVMRFWVYEIRDDLPSVVARIQEWLRQWHPK